MDFKYIKKGDIVKITNDSKIVVAEACGVIGPVIGRAQCNGKDTVFILSEKSRSFVSRCLSIKYDICLKHLGKGVFSFANPLSIKKRLEPSESE